MYQIIAVMFCTCSKYLNTGLSTIEAWWLKNVLVNFVIIGSMNQYRFIVGWTLSDKLWIDLHLNQKSNVFIVFETVICKTMTI